MTTLLVIGASQGIGLETVKCALARGHDVRAFARGAAGIAIDDAKLTKIAGDALDAPAVAAAVVGADAVIQVLGAPKTAMAVLAGTTLFSKATRILVDAMRAAGVRRLVTVTGFGAGDSRGHGGFIYDAVMKAFNADGITLTQFNEPAGGQVVFHLHFHVLPRWDGVALGPHTDKMEKPEVLAATAGKIKKALV